MAEFDHSRLPSSVRRKLLRDQGQLVLSSVSVMEIVISADPLLLAYEARTLDAQT